MKNCTKYLLTIALLVLAVGLSYSQPDLPGPPGGGQDVSAPISGLLGLGLAVGAVIGCKKLFGKKGLKED
jgi:hypothetical protein